MKIQNNWKKDQKKFKKKLAKNIKANNEIHQIKDPPRPIYNGGLKVMLEDKKATAEKLTTGKVNFITGASPKHCLKLKWH